jgi:hypothetical protein
VRFVPASRAINYRGMRMRSVWAATLQTLALVAFAAEVGFAEEDANLLRESVPMPSRATIWNLPPQPNRPSLPMPHFSQETILPEPIHVAGEPAAQEY